MINEHERKCEHHYFYLILTLNESVCYRTNFEATPPPILIDNGLAVLENEKIERHIMKNVPGGHNLFVQDKEVATLIENLYSVSYNTYILCINLSNNIIF